MRYTKSSLLVVVSLCLLVLTACTPSYVNLEDLGPRSTPDEITRHYSGNSISYADEFGGKVNVETYYGADGTFKRVLLDEPMFAIGTWRLHTALKSTTMLIEMKGYSIENGKVVSWNERHGVVVYIQPDGTARLDEMGGGNITQPKPTRRFRSEARFNSLRRQAGL